MRQFVLDKSSFGRTADGSPVDLYTLGNPTGAIARVMTYGATLTELLVPDRHNTPGNVVLGYATLADYESQSRFVGATIGRVANRIAFGKITLDDVQHSLRLNDGRHHLHGGPNGYHRRVWRADAALTPDGASVRFALKDDDRRSCYPGTVDVTVTYTLRADDTLAIAYHATTDQATPINLTHHSYFNLHDVGTSPIAHHLLQIAADTYTPVDEELIPTGQIAPVADTALDFTHARAIGTTAYDHNFVLRPHETLARAARVYEAVSARVMEVWTTQPSLQLYTTPRAFCLEAQHSPDAVNHSNFPSTILRPDGVYAHVAEYRFRVSPSSPF